MNYPKNIDQIQPWIKPCLTVLLGLILIFRPDSVTSVIGSIIGLVILAVGTVLLISFFRGYHKDGLRLAAAVILMVLGLSVVRSPLSLVSQLGRFIGILLVLQSVRELIGEVPMGNKLTCIVTGIAGAVLMLVPMSGSRLVLAVCGIAVLGAGIGMLTMTYRLQRTGGPKERIIDER